MADNGIPKNCICPGRQDCPNFIPVVDENGVYCGDIEVPCDFIDKGDCCLCLKK